MELCFLAEGGGGPGSVNNDGESVTGKLTAPLWGWIDRCKNATNSRRMKERHVGMRRLEKERDEGTRAVSVATYRNPFGEEVGLKHHYCAHVYA
ncbi:unnamed protein product [Dovyalis caffra]|uniref:Uncharacterized protein n=1 Tax=Dovyalis caffra TaxID=77055 RepID=A0AAV1RQG2_9ROSI|nr:unnamed protein product [Dovyalis caffra]